MNTGHAEYDIRYARGRDRALSSGQRDDLSVSDP